MSGRLTASGASPWLLAATLGLVARPALATPLHGLRTGAACGTCHVSPGGGGLRTAAGRDWAGADLPTFSLRQPTAPHGRVRPEWFSLGADATFDLVTPTTDLAPDAGLHGALSLAVRPYNPLGDREGRVTLVAVPALSEEETFQVTEYFVLFDDLLFDLGWQAGRFVAPFGERFPEADLFDSAAVPREAALTGAALHVRPGVWRFAVATGRPDTRWDDPLDTDAGWETTATLGWQPDAGRLGVSGAIARGTQGRRERYALHGGVDLGRLAGVPLTALGEYDLEHGPGTSGPNTVGLLAQYLLAWQITRGVEWSARYAWRDPDTVVRYDSRHALYGELRWDALSYTDVRFGYAHAWQYDRDRFRAENDTATLSLHGGF